jgi:hypothetical protein
MLRFDWKLARRSFANHHLWTAMLTFAAFGSLTFIFSLMWIQGSVQAVEPSSWIRGTELGFSVILMSYGFWRFLVERKRSLPIDK